MNYSNLISYLKSSSGDRVEGGFVESKVGKSDPRPDDDDDDGYHFYEEDYSWVTTKRNLVRAKKSSRSKKIDPDL
jgi:hypothetical protein